MARENSTNKRYSKLEKEKLIARMLPPENISVSDLSKETGISKSTLQTWKTKAVNPKNTENNTGKRVVTPKDRFLTVMETYLLSEAELARYCREKGLFVEDVKKWHNACLNSTAGNADSDDVKELKLKQQEDAKRIKALEKDLQFKEKALAETAALLVLRKKLQAILVENVED
jgi:transposase